MQSSFITVLALVASVVAVPAPVNVNANMVRLKEAIATNYTWTVSSWKGCDAASTSACAYSFQVSAPASGSSVPAFNASCAGTVGVSYETCTGPASGQLVKAKIQPNGTESAQVAVSYLFDDPSAAGTYWNYTSYATEPYTQSGLVFSMQPSEIWGAA